MQARSIGFLIGCVAIVSAVIASLRFAPSNEVTFPVSAIHTTSSGVEAAGLCPWRSPKDDLQALFPGADHYEQHLVILSDLRLDISQRLGPNGLLDANGIYAYRVTRGGKSVGSILAQRAAGEYGAIEYVMAVAPDGSLAGVRLQRQREPDAIARTITSPAFLKAFAGKTAASPFHLGGDLPAVAPAARQTARSLVDSVRRLLIEFTVAREHGR